MPKMPPEKGKSNAQMWKEFGDFMNARDVKGNPRLQGNAVKSRALGISKYVISKGGGAMNVPGGASGSSTSASKSPKRPVRGGGSMAGDLKARGSEGPKRSGAVRKSVSMTGGLANKIERAYPVKARPSNASEGPKRGSVAAARNKAGSEGSKRSGAVGVKKNYKASLRGGKAYPTKG